VISTPGAVRRCTRILWPGKASEKTPRGVIPPVCVKNIAKRLKKKDWRNRAFQFFNILALGALLQSVL
jgi:hypothetical protein